MAIEWDVYLGTTGPTGKLSAFGRKVTIDKKETTRDRRAADGTLKQDILYVKHEFTISYARITETALDVLDYWYEYYQTNKTPLSLYLYTSAVAYDQYSVIPKPVSRTRVVKAADNIYSGASLTLVEI